MLSVGTLVGYVELDVRGVERGATAVRRDMDRLATDITRTTERAGERAGQNLGQGLADGARDGAADAAQAAVAGLDPLVRGATTVGAAAGAGLGGTLTSAARTAGQDAAAAGGTALAGLEAHARAAGDAAGAAVDDRLVSAARRAGAEAGERAGEALESELEASAEEAGEQGGEAVAEGLTAQDAAVGLAGAALGLAFIAGFGEALDNERIVDRMNAQIGATGQAAGQYGDLAGRLWRNAVVEQVQDGADVVKSIAQQGIFPPEATEAQMERIATRLADVSNLMGEDFGRTAATVASMLRNGLAPSAEHAMDVLTVGMQLGTNKAEDLLDTFFEYSPFFRQLGLNAEESLGLMNQGLQEGAWNSDIMADSLKEGLLIMQEMGEDAGAAIEELGLDVEATHQAFTRGGPPARAALQQVLDALRAVENPTRQNALAVDLFGTKLEDAQKAIYALDPRTAAQGMDQLAGAAERAGVTMRDNASTNIEKFKRSIQSGIVEVIGGEVIPVLMDMARFASSVWEGIPEGGQGTIQVLATAALVIGGVTLAFSLASRGAAAFRTWLATVQTQAATTSVAMRGLQLSMGVVGIALVAATTVMSLFGAANRSAKMDSTGFAKSLEQDAGRIGKYTREQALAALETAGLGKSAQAAGIDMGRMVDALLGVPGAAEEVTAKFREYSATLKGGSAVMKDSEIQQKVFEKSLQDAQGAMASGREEYDRSQQAQAAFEAQTEDTTETAEDQEKALDELGKALDALRGQYLDARGAQSDLEAAVDEATKTIGENGRTLDIGTEKGRANDEALRDLVESAYALSEATLRQTGSQEAANGVLLQQRERFAAVLVQMGYTRDEASRLTAQYYRIPDGISTRFAAETSSALGAIGGLSSRLAGIPRTVTIDVQARVEGGISSRIAAMIGNRYEDGGIRLPTSVRNYAEGQHVAQIARAGEWRVWAEEETGGEAYIPLAAAKRQRSTAILSEVAQRFGYQLTPRGRGFADGGTAGAAGSAGGNVPTVRVAIDLSGADAELRQRIRRMVRVDGRGSVQVAFGGN